MTTFHRTTVAVLAAFALASPAVAQGPAHAPPRRDNAALLLTRTSAMLAQLADAQREAAARQRAAAREREIAERQRQAEARRAQQRAKLPEVTEPYTRTVRLGRSGTIDLQNIAGEVVITGGGGDEVRIQATRRARHQVEAEARRALAAVEINVVERGGNVDIRTLQPRGRNIATAVDYTLAVPGGANVVISTGAGNVRISNVSGELRAATISGNIALASVRRVRRLTTVSGTIDVAEAQADELTASTVGGDVMIRNLKGRLLELTTVHGDVRLVDVEMERVHLQSAAGDLEYAGRLARSGSYRLQTHSGNIRVTPSGNAGFDLAAGTLSGDVRSEYTLTPRDAAGRGRARPGRSLSGTFGDGGAALTADTFSGDILIVRR